MTTIAIDLHNGKLYVDAASVVMLLNDLGHSGAAAYLEDVVVEAEMPAETYNPRMN